jgi:hypothetical protein
MCRSPVSSFKGLTTPALKCRQKTAGTAQEKSRAANARNVLTIVRFARLFNPPGRNFFTLVTLQSGAGRRSSGQKGATRRCDGKTPDAVSRSYNLSHKMIQADASTRGPPSNCLLSMRWEQQ